MPVTRPEKCAVLACELMATLNRAMPTTSIATPLSKEAKGQNKGFTQVSGKRGAGRLAAHALCADSAGAMPMCRIVPRPDACACAGRDLGAAARDTCSPSVVAAAVPHVARRLARAAAPSYSGLQPLHLPTALRPRQATDTRKTKEIV